MSCYVGIYSFMFTSSRRPEQMDSDSERWIVGLREVEPDSSCRSRRLWRSQLQAGGRWENLVWISLSFPIWISLNFPTLISPRFPN